MMSLSRSCLRSMALAGPLCFAAAISSSSLLAQDDADARIAEALRVTTDGAKRYQFEIGGEQGVELKMHPDSVLRWSNPIAGELYGNVFVWTHNGRPEVVGSLLQWYSPHTHGSHEMHSLSTGPILGSRDGEQVWASTAAGVDLKPVPERVRVAPSPPTRLTQMRSLARRFSIQKTDREGAGRELRMLAQPLVRFGDADSDVLDGGLFVFVQGTDPEVFLLVEARKEDDQWRWHYALARMNSVKFVASYNEKEVWSVEIWPWGKAQNGREIYFHSGRVNP